MNSLRQHSLTDEGIGKNFSFDGEVGVKDFTTNYKSNVLRVGLKTAIRLNLNEHVVGLNIQL